MAGRRAPAPIPAPTRTADISAPQNELIVGPAQRKIVHRPQGSTASRQSVMSVRSLVSPSPGSSSLNCL